MICKSAQVLHRRTSKLNPGAFARGLTDGGWSTRSLPCAAIFSQVAKERVHRVKLCRVDHRAALTAHGDKSGLVQSVKMKGQCVRRNTQRGGHFAGRRSCGPRLYQQSKRIEATFLRQCGQSDRGLCFDRISMTIEIILRDTFVLSQRSISVPARRCRALRARLRASYRWRHRPNAN